MITDFSMRERVKELLRENQGLRELSMAMEKEVQALRSSLSWKVTAPLRRIHAMLTGHGAVEGERRPAPSGSALKEVRDSAEILEHLRIVLQQKLSLFLSVPDARIVLPSFEAPEVSIILVLFNRAEYTFQCLESIMAHVDLPFEVIIYDNGSTDDTGRLLGRIDNARIIPGGENLGFLLACNRAADEARGRWILFLNNDTQVLPGFLSRMVGTASRFDRCGAVGAKLVHPNGRLQEAGSIVWRDGSSLGYGRGGDPDSPEYNFVREVDYCSGASLLVDRELFLSLGKFDERYAPAYYEETDFCMTLRRHGYRVIYQPQAAIIHYEFGSADKQDSSLGLQGVNRLKFREKWKSVLDSVHLPPHPDNIPKGRERLAKGERRILVIDDRIPDPALGSGFPRSNDIIRFMADAGWRVTVYPMQNGERPVPVTDRMGQMGIETLYGDGSYGFDFFYAERAGMYDLVWISRPHNMEAAIDSIRNYTPDLPVVYDGEALFAMRDIIRARVTGEPLSPEEEKGSIEKELSLVSRADALVAVSPRELEVLGDGLVPEAPRVVLGHAFDVEPTCAGFDERYDILFVGGILASPSPNEDAVTYFVKEILPLVRREIDVRFWIVGTVEVESVRRLASEHVVVTGRVDDLRPFYESCRLFVVPTRYAGGIPYKLQEALAHGIPAVVTPLVADQLSLDESVVLVGDGPESFARKVVSLHADRNLWESLRRSGLDYVARECASSAYSKRLIAFLDDVARRRIPRIKDGKDLIP